MTFVAVKTFEKPQLLHPNTEMVVSVSQNILTAHWSRQWQTTARTTVQSARARSACWWGNLCIYCRSLLRHTHWDHSPTPLSP